MNTPNLPTDSLYKFLALSGVFLVVVSIIVPARLVYDAEIEVWRLTGEVAASFHAKRLSMGPEYAMALQEFNASGSLDWANIDSEEMALLDSLSKLASDSAQVIHEANFARLLASQEILKRQLFEAYLWKWIGRVGVLVGLAMAVAGFRLWYTQLQQYLDKIVQRQAAASARGESGRRHKFE